MHTLNPTTLHTSEAPDTRAARLHTSLLPLLLLVGLVSGLGSGCAAAKKPLRAQMRPMRVHKQHRARHLKHNHFRSDRTGNLTEAQLRKILDAPVFLEDEARIGIVPVATAYNVDRDIPLTTVPHTLSSALEQTGFFEVTTEVSTDWPRDRSIAGLRELAARYRAKYLMLYRHRFIHRQNTNAWGWAYLTLVGALFVPSQNVEVAGVMEATLFDVRTGTILFTVYERVNHKERMNIWNNDEKRRTLKERMLNRAADRLAGKVTHKVRRLVAARPAPKTPDIKAAPKTGTAKMTLQKPTPATSAKPAPKTQAKPTPPANAPAKPN